MGSLVFPLFKIFSKKVITKLPEEEFQGFLDYMKVCLDVFPTGSEAFF